MSSKMGRPKVDNPKNIDVKVRFDENTHKKLLDYYKKKSGKACEWRKEIPPHFRQVANTE